MMWGVGRGGVKGGQLPRRSRGAEGRGERCAGKGNRNHTTGHKPGAKKNGAGGNPPGLLGRGGGNANLLITPHTPS